MIATILLLVLTAPQGVQPHISVATEACLPLLKAQSKELRATHTRGLDQIQATNEWNRKRETARLEAECHSKALAIAKTHEREISHKKDEHDAQMAAATSQWHETLASCMQTMLTMERETYIHRLDSDGGNDIFVKRAVSCGSKAIIQFGIRQLLDDTPFHLREVTTDHSSGRVTLSTHWSKPGVLSGIAVFALADKTQTSVDIVFRGVDAVEIDNVELVR